MKIERRKVECVGEFNPRTKARLVALLGLSAALSVPAEPDHARFYRFFREGFDIL